MRAITIEQLIITDHVGEVQLGMRGRCEASSPGVNSWYLSDSASDPVSHDFSIKRKGFFFLKKKSITLINFIGGE